MLLDERGVYLPADAEGGVAVMPALAMTAGGAAMVGAAAAAPRRAESPRPAKRARRFPVYGGFIVFLSILAAGAILLLSLRQNSGLLAVNPTAPDRAVTTEGNAVVLNDATPPGGENAAPTPPIEATATEPAVTPTPRRLKRRRRARRQPRRRR